MHQKDKSVNCKLLARINYIFVFYFKHLYKTLELEALALICAIQEFPSGGVQSSD